MTAKELLQELESLGTEQNRKIYKRHGIGENMFGVSYANLGKLKKRIKVDHDLAQKLWASGNHDARVLATMIADPAQADDKLLESWVKDLSNYVITDAFAMFAGQTPLTRQKAEKWTKAKGEWIASAGWILLGSVAMRDKDLPDDYFENILAIVERDIHSSKNRVKYSMNNALIGIGLRNDSLEKKAIAAAKRIGKVGVDHGETGCKTPDAVAYIQKARQRRK
jgi:3-methyladenine DNA glycosylase AlkD